MKFVIKVLYDAVLLREEEPQSRGLVVVMRVEGGMFLINSAWRRIIRFHAYTIILFAFKGSPA